jgi:hypothetical protein
MIMGNEHPDYEGDVDVPAKAIQIVDPEVVASMYHSVSIASHSHH